MDISNNTIITFRDFSHRDFGDIYDKYFSQSGIDFDDYLTRFIKDEQSNLSYDDIENAKISSKVNYIRKTRQNLVHKLITKSFEGIDAQDKNNSKVDKATYAFEKFKSLEDIRFTKKAPEYLRTTYVIYTNEKLAEEYGDKSLVKNYEDAKEIIANELEKAINWASDNNNYITSFGYLSEICTPTMMEKYFKRDLDLLFVKTIQSVSVQEEVDAMILFSSRFTDAYPPDPTNRLKVKSLKRAGDYFSYQVEKNADEGYEIMFYQPGVDKSISDLYIKAINEFDYKVIKVILQFADYDFFEKRIITCDLGAIVEVIDKYKSNSTYNAVYNSIMKISSCTSRYVNKKTGKTFDLKYFTASIDAKRDYDDDLVIETNDVTYEKSEVDDLIKDNHYHSSEEIDFKKYRKLIVTAEFTRFYVESILEDAIFIDNELDRKYTYRMCNALLMPLQNERYKLLNSGKGLEIKLGYTTFFNVVLLLGDSNKGRNMTYINKALTLFKENGDIISDFIRGKDYFIVTFLPLSDSEKRKVFSYIQRMSIEKMIKLPMSF